MALLICLWSCNAVRSKLIRSAGACMIGTLLHCKGALHCMAVCFWARNLTFVPVQAQAAVPAHLLPRHLLKKTAMMTT